MLILTAEAHEEDLGTNTVQEYSNFICSRLQPLNQNGFGRQRVIVVDAETGHPIEGAKVEFYYLDKDDNRKDIATLMTDAEGRAVLDDEAVNAEKDFRMMRKVTYKDDIHLSATTSYFSYNDRNREEGWETNTTLRLYSDRAIYRPGQVMHIGGIIYEVLLMGLGDEQRVIGLFGFVKGMRIQ